MLVNLRNKILPILAQKGWSIELLAEKCEITKAGLFGILKKNDTKASTLDRIATELGIHTGEFYTVITDTVNTVNEPNMPYGKPQQVDYLLTKVIDLETELKTLKNDENSKK